MHLRPSPEKNPADIATEVQFYPSIVDYRVKGETGPVASEMDQRVTADESVPVLYMFPRHTPSVSSD